MYKIFEVVYVLPYEEVRKERIVKIIAKDEDEARYNLRRQFKGNNVYIKSVK